MECKQQLKWLMLAMICPLIAGAPSSMSKGDGSCPKENINITGGTFVLSNNYSHGSLLRYICPNGYYPSVHSRLCQNEHWTTKTKMKKNPECKKITCPNPRVFENGEVAPYKEKYYVNDTTTYSCNSDYTFRGSAVRVCKPNGKWSGSTPICGRDSDHCPDPGVPPGSSRTGNMFNTDDKVTYSCASPLTLIGSKERVCQDGGQWSGTEPQCYADFTYDTPEEASEAFSSSLKSNLAVEKEEQQGKKITLDQGGKLDIYIAVDASDSVEEKDFDNAKTTIKLLLEKLHSAIKAYGVPWASPISSHPMWDWIAPSSGQPSVSLIYSKCNDHTAKPLSIKSIWNRELTDFYLSVDWKRVWSNLILTSKNLAHCLIHFKVIHRAYITPYKRFKMKLQPTYNCHICNTVSSGTFHHMFLECPIVVNLWTHVNSVSSFLLQIDYTSNPGLCLLNDDSNSCISSLKKRMLLAGFTAAKKYKTDLL